VNYLGVLVGLFLDGFTSVVSKNTLFINLATKSCF